MKRRSNLIFIFVIFVVGMIISCTKKQADEVTPDQPTSTPGTSTPGGTGESGDVVYTGAIANIFTTNCNGCHAAGKQGSGSWTFSGYTSVINNSANIKQAVLVNKTMPLSGTLSSSDLKLLQQWFDSGLKQ